MANFKELNLSSYPPALQAALGQMNEAQMRVCQLVGGLSAVIGVAGSGKTRALVNLLAVNVADGVDPNKILAMTFTRNAAQEMNERLVGMGIEGARVGTIHSVCRQIVASEGKMFEGIEMDNKGFLPMELKKCLTDMRRARKIPQRGSDKDQIKSFIGECKARGTVWVAGDPFNLNMQFEASMYDTAQQWANACGMPMLQLGSVFMEMEKRRESRGLYDFDDMLLWAWMTLVSDGGARQRWSSKWDLIIVDECQDSNPVQWDIARILAGLDSCILNSSTEPCAVGAIGGYVNVNPEVCFAPAEKSNSLYVFGDAAQSIYKFRAAVPELFVEFTKRSDVSTLPLPYNYRSTPAVCATGSTLVRGKPWHLSGDMIPAGILKTDPLLPRVELLGNIEEEASTAVQWAMELAANGCADEGLNSTAVLSRTAMALHLAEIECIRARIPYRKRCSGSFFDSKEARDVLAYLTVACGQDGQGEKALRRTINSPFRYISKKYIDSCGSIAMSNNTSMLDVMMSEDYELSPRPRQSLHEWASLLSDLNGIAVRSEEMAKKAPTAPGSGGDGDADIDRRYVGPAVMISTMLRQTDYIENLRREEGLGEEGGRVAILAEMQRMAEQFISPLEYLTYITELRAAVAEGAQKLGRGEEDNREALTLSTIHRAKGLEWTNVRLIDLSASRFPHAKAKDQDEELRLLYVAVTRAKRELVVTAHEGHGKEAPSSFVDLMSNTLRTITGT